MNPKLILITGISGFVAKHCAIELLKHGYAVRGTLRQLSNVAEVQATLANHCDIATLQFVQADLCSDEGWAQAMVGVYGVLHVASPFPLHDPHDANDLLAPAVDGTLRVLKAAVAAKVQRFVQTSSTAAMVVGHPKARQQPFAEDDWSQLDGTDVSLYAQSKTLAERAARDFMAAHQPAMHFASVNPGFVLGPVLDRNIGTSAIAIQMFLRGKYPGCPKLSFPVVDVRDVATMHRLALETDLPSGGRYVGVSGTAWFSEMMRPIKAKLGARASKVPSMTLPNFAVRMAGWFDPAARAIVPALGSYLRIDNSQTRRALKMEFIGVEESAPAMAQSLVDLGLG